MGRQYESRVERDHLESLLIELVVEHPSQILCSRLRGVGTKVGITVQAMWNRGYLKALSVFGIRYRPICTVQYNGYTREPSFKIGNLGRSPTA